MSMYTLDDTPEPCPVCGTARTIEIDMADDEAEPFAWCEPCGIGTFGDEVAQ